MEIGHWKKDCPKLLEKVKGGSSGAKAHITQEIAYAGESDVSLSIIPQCLLTDDSGWILDTGATFHICLNLEWFCTYKSLDSGVVTLGNNQTCSTISVGSILIRMHDGAVRELTEVRHVSEIRKNLLSVGALEAKGYKVVIEAEILKISRGALVVMRGVRHHNLYFLQGKTVTGTMAVADDSVDATILWHRRLTHAGEASLQALAMKELIEEAKSYMLEFCEHCVLGKKARISFDTAVHSTKGMLEHVHSDVCFVSFIVDYSRFVWVYTISRESEVLEIIVAWKKWIETETDKWVRCIRSNHGDEYTSNGFLQ